jgi:hypothetical protein
MSRSTVQVALSELGSGAQVSERVRRAGAGRKKLVDTDPGLAKALDDLVEPTARGDPMSPLRWTAKSLRTLADELTRQGHPVGASKVGQLLRGLGYSLQAPAKEVEGAAHEDRNAQFGHINDEATEHLDAGQPVISIDTKRSKLLGTLPTKDGSTGPRATAKGSTCTISPTSSSAKPSPSGCGT